MMILYIYFVHKFLFEKKNKKSDFEPLIIDI